MAAIVVVTSEKEPEVSWEYGVLCVHVGMATVHLTPHEYEVIRDRAEELIGEHLDPPKDPIGEAMGKKEQVAWQELGGGQP